MVFNACSLVLHAKALVLANNAIMNTTLRIQHILIIYKSPSLRFNKYFGKEFQIKGAQVTQKIKFSQLYFQLSIFLSEQPRATKALLLTILLLVLLDRGCRISYNNRTCHKVMYCSSALVREHAYELTPYPNIE